MKSGRRHPMSVCSFVCYRRRHPPAKGRNEVAYHPSEGLESRQDDRLTRGLARPKRAHIFRVRRDAHHVEPAWCSLQLFVEELFGLLYPIGLDIVDRRWCSIRNWRRLMRRYQDDQNELILHDLRRPLRRSWRRWPVTVCTRPPLSPAPDRAAAPRSACLRTSTSLKGKCNRCWLSRIQRSWFSPNLSPADLTSAKKNSLSRYISRSGHPARRPQ